MNRRSRRTLIAACLVLALAGCKKTESLIVAQLTSPDADAAAVRSVSVSAGGITRTFDATSGLSAAQSLDVGLYVPSSAVGMLPVVATASVAGGKCFRGEGTATISSAGSTATVPIALAAVPCAGADGGAGSDGATSAGGATGSGGATSAGGATGSGGATASGGATGSDGGAGKIGTDGGSAGGATGSGGAIDAGADGSIVDAGTDRPTIAPPPSLNNCTEINQFNDAGTTNWGITQVAFSPDGHYLAAGDQSGQVVIWTMNGGTATKEGHAFTFPGAGNARPVFSPNGLLMAAATSNGGFSLWNVGGNWSKRGDFPSNANSDFEGVAFTPDSSRVVAVDFGSSTLQILDPATLTTVGTPRTLPAKPDSLAVSPVAAGAALYAAVGMNDGRIAIVDLNAASTTAPQLVTGSSTTDDIPAVAFSPDGKVLAAGSSLELTSVTLWNVGPQVTAKTPAPNLGANVEGGIAGLAFSPDGASLLVGYGYFSPTVGIWDVATAQNHGTKVPRESPLGVSFSPGGAVAVAGEAFYGWILVCAD